MPATTEEEWAYWDSKATDLRRTQLATVNASAAKWSAMTATLLAIFGAVAFAGGLTTLDKLTSPFDLIAKIITTLALVTGVIGTVLLAVTAGGLGLKTVGSLNGPTLKSILTIQTKSQARLLFWGRIAAASTAGLVVAGSVLILWFGRTDPAAPSNYLVILDEQTACGTLSAADDGHITVGGVSLADVRTILPIASCPES